MYKNSEKKYHQLRKNYPVFIFESYRIRYNKTEVQIVYEFKLGDEIVFKPDISVSLSLFDETLVNSEVIEVLAFHLGMVEMISYWKAACSPQIIVKPYKLSGGQLKWWKKLFYHGLGEFFHINQIQADYNDFVTFICKGDQLVPKAEIKVENGKVLVPVGGGKDSNVSMELLKNHFEVIPFIINPRKATINSVIAAGFKESDIFRIERNIDPALLKLNADGFLNGHTPFSAVVAFSSLIAAHLTKSKHIALSNESSANEPTDLVSGVNHQYSKSYEFEKDFRQYVADFITREINYFSFLRPLSEFQIARLFSGMKPYHPVFRSCNVGSKKDVWCAKCSKCLFTYIILSPFLSREELIDIFGNDLLDDPGLVKVFRELTGMEKLKPFECVGTIEEVKLSLSLAMPKYMDKLPFLLEKFDFSLSEREKETQMQAIQKLNDEHFLNDDFLKVLEDENHV